MLTVNVRDRDARQLFFRYSLEAPQIDCSSLLGSCPSMKLLAIYPNYRSEYGATLRRCRDAMLFGRLA